jgi:methionyl-tRNA formyltransferase
VLCDALWDFGKGDLIAHPQDHSAATYCSKLQKADGDLDPRVLPLCELYPHYRAFAIWPKVRFTVPTSFARTAGTICIIESLLLDENLYTSQSIEPLIQGTTLHAAVRELIVKPEGKKAMSWEAFVNGYLL